MRLIRFRVWGSGLRVYKASGLGFRSSGFTVGVSGTAISEGFGLFALNVEKPKTRNALINLS